MTEERLKELVPDIVVVDLFDAGNKTQQQTDNLRKAVKALEDIAIYRHKPCNDAVAKAMAGVAIETLYAITGYHIQCYKFSQGDQNEMRKGT